MRNVSIHGLYPLLGLAQIHTIIGTKAANDDKRAKIGEPQFGLGKPNEAPADPGRRTPIAKAFGRDVGGRAAWFWDREMSGRRSADGQQDHP